MAERIDFEAEGLLEGLDDEQSRAARIVLLEQLHAAGVGLDELKRAVTQDRLALLPVERLLAPDAKYTHAQLAERAGLDEEFQQRLGQALGFPTPAPEDVVFNDEDVEAAKRMRRFREAGLPDEGLLEVSRLLGHGMARYTEAMRVLFGQAFIEPGDTEGELGARYVEAAQELLPLVTPMLEYVMNRHLRELLRSDFIGRAERESGRLEGTTETAVAFADLVGFTRLGSSVDAEELGSVAGRLGRLGVQAAEPPVRLVKTIGDAVMFVSDDTDRLIGAVLDLVRAGEADEQLPGLRAGVAHGPAVNLWGDWYGTTVNLASRVTSRARPGSVLVTKGARDAAHDDYRWSSAGPFRLKGFRERVELYRVRRAEDDS